MKDVRGIELYPGLSVAFNLSGDVAKGTIMAVGKPILVRLDHRAAGQHPGHISKVRRERSLLVLWPEDGS